MLNNLNIRPRNKSQRILFSAITGLVCAIVLGFAYGGIMHYMNIPVELQAVFMFIGMGIGLAIQKIGRGVQGQLEISIIAAISAFICFLLADMVTMFGFNIFTTNINMLPTVLRFTLRIWFDFSVGNTFSMALSLLFRGAGIYFAYRNAVLMVNR